MVVLISQILSSEIARIEDLEKQLDDLDDLISRGNMVLLIQLPARVRTIARNEPPNRPPSSGRAAAFLCRREDPMRLDHDPRPVAWIRHP